MVSKKNLHEKDTGQKVTDIYGNTVKKKTLTEMFMEVLNKQKQN